MVKHLFAIFHWKLVEWLVVDRNTHSFDAESSAAGTDTAKEDILRHLWPHYPYFS